MTKVTPHMCKFSIDGRSMNFQNKVANNYTYLTILPGLRSKFFLTMSVSSVVVFEEVPKLKTVMDRGSATPMAYDTWTRQRRHRPALTKDLATHLWETTLTVKVGLSS